MRKHLLLGLLLIIVCAVLVTCTSLSSGNDTLYFKPFIPYTPYIVSPYSAVDWENFGQYKAALHAHSTNSDGAFLFHEVIEDHYEKNFDILAVTDHDVVTSDWVTARNGLTRQRFNEITSGADRSGRGMLQIPFTNEQSQSDHVNTFFTNFNNAVSATLRSNIEKTHKLGGISIINHPGRHTGAEAGGIEGEKINNDTQVIKKYVDLFMEFPSCVGMEIINKADGESVSDRILWDNILSQTIPLGRYVWGFSNDDSHAFSGTGLSFNMFLMPENTIENFKKAIFSGSFYAVARVSKRELGSHFWGSGPFPVITNINVDID